MFYAIYSQNYYSSLELQLLLQVVEFFNVLRQILGLTTIMLAITQSGNGRVRRPKGNNYRLYRWEHAHKLMCFFSCY